MGRTSASRGTFFCPTQLLRRTFPWEINLNAFQRSVTLPGYTHFSMAPLLSSSKSISFTWCQRSILVFKLPSHWIRYGKPVDFIAYKKALRRRTEESNIKAKTLDHILFFSFNSRGEKFILYLVMWFMALSAHAVLIMQFMNLALEVFTIFFVCTPLVWACSHINKCPALNMSEQGQTWSSCTGQGYFWKGKLSNASRKLARKSRTWTQSLGLAF